MKGRKNTLPPIPYADFRQQVGERAQLRRQLEREKRRQKQSGKEDQSGPKST